MLCVLKWIDFFGWHRRLAHCLRDGGCLELHDVVVRVCRDESRPRAEQRVCVMSCGVLQNGRLKVGTLDIPRRWLADVVMRVCRDVSVPSGGVSFVCGVACCVTLRRDESVPSGGAGVVYGVACWRNKTCSYRWCDCVSCDANALAAGDGTVIGAFEECVRDMKAGHMHMERQGTAPATSLTT